VLVLVLENDCTGANLLWRRSVNHWRNGLNSPFPIEDENENEVLSDGSSIRSVRDDRVRCPGGQLHSRGEGTSGLERRHG
jgi:hypothetical protein